YRNISMCPESIVHFRKRSSQNENLDEFSETPVAMVKNGKHSRDRIRNIGIQKASYIPKRPSYRASSLKVDACFSQRPFEIRVQAIFIWHDGCDIRVSRRI